MYTTGYSQVSKSSPQTMKKVQYRSKSKSCGYYMRIVFFFSSLIQSLIIVSLVLFLVYGKSQDSPSTSRIHDLEESFSRLSIENLGLRQQKKNLTNYLNATLTEKARNDWDLAKVRHFANISMLVIQDIDRRQQQCNRELFLCKGMVNVQPLTRLVPTDSGCNCGLLVEQLKARLTLVESNFTQTIQKMRGEMDQTAKERDNINLEVIHLRRDKFTHEKEVEFFRQKCKDDFAQSLSGISNVSKAFLEKINTLFPSHIAFQLTCPKQREHLEQIRTNCTSLSVEVEDRFQRYLNNVGQQVTNIQGESSRLKAENLRLSEDYRWCSTNRTGLILQNRQNLDKLQRKNDEEKERLLMDKLRLNGDIEVLNNNVRHKSKVIDHLTEQLKQLNMSCMVKTGYGGFPSRPGTQPGFGLFGGGGSSPAIPPSFSQLGRTGTGGLGPNLGSFGSAFNKPASTGLGSPTSSLGSSNPIGSAFNKPASSGTGSSSSSLGSGSSFGSAFNKPASSGTGSSSSSLGSGSSFGSAFNKPASSGTGSSSSSLGSGSSFGSAFNKPASSGTGSSSSSLGSGSSFGSAFNKPASSGTGSSSSSLGSGSSFGSAFNKPASSGTGSSSSSLGSGSSFGSAFNKPASSGTGSSSSSASSSGSGSSTASKPSSGGGVFPNFGSAGSSSSSGTAQTGKSSSSSTSLNSNPSSSGTGSNKPTTSGKSPGSSWFGFGSSSSQSRAGSGPVNGPSPGNSFGGTGSIGAGRTNGLGGGSSGLGGGSGGLGGGSSINVAQHLRDLQRFINPSGPEEKQDLSRMLG